MKTLYLECNMGAAGDMLMAALYELLEDKAGVPGHYEQPGAPRGAPGGPGRASTCGIAGTHMAVTVDGEEEDGTCRPGGRQPGPLPRTTGIMTTMTTSTPTITGMSTATTMP